MENKRRAQDADVAALIQRVEDLDNDVKRLRTDFEDHTKLENTKMELLSATLISIQVKLDQLIIDIKEPVEAYRTAKSGMTLLKFVAETAKWLVPLCVGLWLGFGSPINTDNNKQQTSSVQGDKK